MFWIVFLGYNHNSPSAEYLVEKSLKRNPVALTGCLGGLHLFKQLAVKSRDLFWAEKKITVAKAEQIKKFQLFSLKMTIFDHLE